MATMQFFLLHTNIQRFLKCYVKTFLFWKLFGTLTRVFLLVFGSETQNYTVEYIHVREYIYEYRNLLIFL